ncbi:hypothetical protein SDC9_164446 [bioreactor metagenome]|uniref:Uncharacterized protein n=1 Tax=bioreactor metagenome TaxID=1076179 RepID=A0A645FTN0_9ZZZZ
MNFSYKIGDKKAIFIYEVKGNNEIQEVLINGIKVETSSLENLYRESGVKINRNKVNNLLTKDENIIRIKLV